MNAYDDIMEKFSALSSDLTLLMVLFVIFAIVTISLLVKLTNNVEEVRKFYESRSSDTD